MESICTRCTRLALRPQRQLHRTTQPVVSKTFTTSVHHRAEDASNSQTPKNTRPARPAQNSSGLPAGTVSINRQPQVLRRTSPPQGGQSNQNNNQPPGPLLRRVGSSGQPAQFLRRTGPPGQSGRPGTQRKGQGQGQNAQGKQRRRRTAESVKAREAEDEEATNEELEEYMAKYIDPPANPTERLEYNPKPQDMNELQKDWPNTPLSATGLSASLIQKIEWLARRIPHGYQTPGQLAEDFQKGNLTRFESEEEKQQVIKIATELAKKRASQLSERKGSDVEAEDMSFVELSSRDEKTKLVNEVVKGEIGQLERQRMPFLESVMRNLRNNQTYHKTEMEGFMATVQKLMPAQAQRRPQQQQAQKTA